MTGLKGRVKYLEVWEIYQPQLRDRKRTRIHVMNRDRRRENLGRTGEGRRGLYKG